MTNKTNWDLLTDDEQHAVFEASDRARLCSTQYDSIEAAINALPARLFQPRLPEGWQIEQCAAGEIQTAQMAKRLNDWASEDPITHVFLSALLAQEGEL